MALIWSKTRMCGVQHYNRVAIFRILLFGVAALKDDLAVER
jgi:hypothetical protein